MATHNVIEKVAAKSMRRRTLVDAVRYIVVHHSVTADTCGWEDMLRIHLRKGYSSIGYHFVIRGSDGEVYKCLPISPAVVGAHAIQQNPESIGVCVTGNYEKHKPKPAALAALKGVLVELQAAYPKAKVMGHKEMQYSRTACPGKYLMAALQ